MSGDFVIHKLFLEFHIEDWRSHVWHYKKNNEQPSCEHSPFKFYTQFQAKRGQKRYYKVPNLPIQRFQKISITKVSSKNKR